MHSRLVSSTSHRQTDRQTDRYNIWTQNQFPVSLPARAFVCNCSRGWEAEGKKEEEWAYIEVVNRRQIERVRRKVIKTKKGMSLFSVIANALSHSYLTLSALCQLLLHVGTSSNWASLIIDCRVIYLYYFDAGIRIQRNNLKKCAGHIFTIALPHLWRFVRPGTPILSICNCWLLNIVVMHGPKYLV